MWEQPGAVAVKMYTVSYLFSKNLVLVFVRFLVKASLRGDVTLLCRLLV